MIVGTFFIFTGSLGILRMPDFFTRLHPASMGDSMGLPLILIGIALHTPFGLVTAKILLLLLFSLVTSSTASHALAKAALLDMKPLGAIKPKPKTKGKS
ncbi:MAG: monovalent cation/H(+) antiporter subunit G [Rickettsiales bacterium]|nr:monovalent cation/H(+) antiporter subunit G [Rickettsiales bacterium]